MGRWSISPPAVKFGLIVASKPDGQDTCLVPPGKYTDVIEKIRPL